MVAPVLLLAQEFTQLLSSASLSSAWGAGKAEPMCTVQEMLPAHTLSPFLGAVQDGLPCIPRLQWESFWAGAVC